MSLDIRLYYLTRDGEVTVHSQNITHNLGLMAGKCGVYKALWRPEESKRNARQLAKIIERGVQKMETRPDYYSGFDAPNGWGTRDQFTAWLKTLRQACLEHPRARIHASR